MKTSPVDLNEWQRWDTENCDSQLAYTPAACGPLFHTGTVDVDEFLYDGAISCPYHYPPSDTQVAIKPCYKLALASVRASRSRYMYAKVLLRKSRRQFAQNLRPVSYSQV